MMEGAQPGRITSILRNIDELTGGLNAQRETFADLLRDARTAASSLTQTLGTVNEVAASFDVRALNRTMAGADRVIQSLDSERIAGPWPISTGSPRRSATTPPMSTCC
jgi:phospholipid/cholesterol/gamma-HCH transport system substrate-binding protein